MALISRLQTVLRLVFRDTHKNEDVASLSSSFGMKEDWTCGYPAAAAFLLLLLVLLFATLVWWKRPRRGSRQFQPLRIRTRTADSTFSGTLFNRTDRPPHQISSDLFRSLELQEDTEATADDELLIASESNPIRFPKQPYTGPAVSHISFKTVTPPPSWFEASRYLVMPEYMRLNLESELVFHLSADQLSLSVGHDSTVEKSALGGSQKKKKKSADLELPVNQFSVHTKQLAGVLELYVQESPRQEWMEHTFESAAAAAQFQTDLMALQLFGWSIMHMYQALQLVHQGSIAVDSREFVLHDSGYETIVNDQPTPVNLCQGIAWDDVMRCLGSSFPSVRQRLEAIKIQLNGTVNPATPMGRGGVRSPRASPRAKREEASADGDGKSIKGNEGETSLTEDYVDKRLLLGPVDFFRLFVPPVPDTAVPRSKSSRARVEQLLRWRKRVARASVLVQAYTRARTVANRGWQLQIPVPDNYIKRRLAYDDSIDNNMHDKTAEKEYYEATVSRDVICQVRNVDYLRKRHWWRFGLDDAVPTMSLCQGYMHVGLHVFRLPASEEEDHPVHYAKDPVLAIPSLRTLIERNPDMDFFLHAFFPESQRIAVMSVFVRSLPKGIDPSFDTVVDRFVRGDQPLRDRKLEVLLEIGVDWRNLSFVTQFILSVLSFLLRVSFGDRILVPQSSHTRGQTRIPALRLSELGLNFHFGGSLQSDPSLPMNYVSATTHIDSRRRNNLATRILINHMEQGGLARDIVDFSYVLAGEEEDELPERVLCTGRTVKLEPKKAAVSPTPISSCQPAQRGLMDDELKQPAKKSDAEIFFKTFFADPLIAAVSELKHFFRPASGERSNPRSPVGTLAAPRRLDPEASVVVSEDPFEKAVNELVEILEDIRIPVRKDQLQMPPTELATASHISVEQAQRDDDVVQVPILQRVSRNDMRRYFLASNCSLKTTVVRIIESAAWRGLTFPIDTRTCRVELQNGQFFQQGRDREGNPVFTFRNMCLGPWREDEDAVIAAVLHRLEASLNAFAKDDPDVRCTLIVIMGRPYQRKKKKRRKKKMDPGDAQKEGKNDDEKTEKTDALTMMSGSTAVNANVNEAVSDDDDESVESDDDCDSVESDDDDYVKAAKSAPMNNPRIHPSENWHVHTSKSLVLRLIELAMTHYPERLNRALVVVRNKSKSYVRTVAGGPMALSKAVSSSQTRGKVRFLAAYKDLRPYVDSSELSTIVGGTMPLDPAVFECQ